MPPTDPLAAIARIAARTAALSEARMGAECWAKLSGDMRFVVEISGRYVLACYQDLRMYHRDDILAGRAQLVYVAQPGAPAMNAPDVAFAPIGWAD